MKSEFCLESIPRVPPEVQRSLSSFDVDLPIEVDDEYWEHPDPEQMFKQPPGKPSVVAWFNNYLKLSRILAFALRTIVCPFPAKSMSLLIFWFFSILSTNRKSSLVL